MVFEEFIATFWWKASVIAGGLFGIATIALVVNAMINYRKNILLKRLLDITEKNYALLLQIKTLLEEKDDNKQDSTKN